MGWVHHRRSNSWTSTFWVVRPLTASSLRRQSALIRYENLQCRRNGRTLISTLPRS